METAKTNAATTGLEVTETEAKTQADEKTAEQDYAKQAIAMDKTVADYKAEVAANQATYEKEKAVVDAKNASGSGGL
ncbi:MAG: hypothetical protein ACLRZG_04895 [Streptococcus sp.]